MAYNTKISNDQLGFALIPTCHISDWFLSWSKSRMWLKATMESNDEESLDEFLVEFCIIANDEEVNIEEDLQTTFEDLYQDFINVGKLNKELKVMIDSLRSENKELKDKVAKLEQVCDELFFTNDELAHQVEQKNGV